MSTADTSRTRTYSWVEQKMDPAIVKAMSGLEFLRAVCEGRLPRPAISNTLDFLLTEVERGRALFEGNPAEYHYNPLGTVHGGFLATLLDSALACAVQSTLAPGLGYTTVELKTNFVRPVFATTGPLVCEAKVINVGTRIGTSEAKLTGKSDGKLYAHGTTTCLIFPLP
jgi:uncharacterized protein (TIGR00369 family)